MAKQSQVDIIINGVDNFSKPMTGAIDGIGKTFAGLATVGGVIAGVGVAAAGAFGALAVSVGMAAAEVNQMQMVTGLMAENAGWSAKMIDQQREALRSSGITAGGTEQALQALMAAELDVAAATDLSRLAQNLAVKTGQDSTQTFLGLVSGIERADAQMLKSAGITVDMASAQEALAAELGKSVGELTAAEKQQAAWNAVIEKSPVYDGLYEAAMEHPIKQLGSLKRLFNDIAVQLGQYFAPAISTVIAGFSDFVKQIIAAISEGGALEPMLAGIGNVFTWIGEQIGAFLSWLGENIPAIIATFQEIAAWFQENEGVIVGILAAIGVSLVALGVTAAQALAPIIAGMLPVIAIMALVGAAAYLLYEAWTNNWGGIQEKTQAVISFVQGVISTALAAIQAWWAEHGEAVMAAVQAMWDAVKTTFETVIAVIQTVVSRVLSEIKAFWDAHGADIMAIVKILWDRVKAAFDQAVAVIKKVVEVVLGFIQGIWEKHGETIMAVVTNMWNIIKTQFEWAKTTLGNIISAIRSALEGDWTAFGETLRQIWDDTWEMIKEVLRLAWDSIKTIVSDLITSVITFFKETDWGAVGKNIIEGIANGITNAVGFIVDAAKNAAKAAFDAAKAFLGIESPSRLFMEVGYDVSKGFAEGIENSLQLPELAARNMGLAALGALQGGGSANNTTNFTINLNGTGEAAEDVINAVRLMEMIYT
jgi:phage-related protein